MTSQEAGELCLLSCLFAGNRDILFPKLGEKLPAISFSEIARLYLQEQGYEPYECQSENEARSQASELISKKKWPCYFFKTDTTGEKGIEEFHTKNEKLDYRIFEDIGVIRNSAIFDSLLLDQFETNISNFRKREVWEKERIVEIFKEILPDFSHIEIGKSLDERM